MLLFHTIANVIPILGSAHSSKPLTKKKLKNPVIPLKESCVVESITFIVLKNRVFENKAKADLVLFHYIESKFSERNLRNVNACRA